MRWCNTANSWGLISQTLHWIVVLLLIWQFTTALIAANLPLGLEKLAMLTRHKSVGMLVLGIVVFRIAWRLANTTPSGPINCPVWQKRLARCSHLIMYLCLIGLPISGWIMSSARNFPVSFFGLFQVPDLVAPDTGLYEHFRSFHGWLACVLAATVSIHILAALKHHFVDRDEVLRRMLPKLHRN